MNELLFKQASDKLEKEIKEAHLDNKSKVIAEPTKKALLDFCHQEDEFAQAIVECSKTFGECCAQIVKDCGSAISDLEVYSQAVKFYFPGADIRFELKIDLCASVNGGNKSLGVSLMDLI